MKQPRRCATYYDPNTRALSLLPTPNDYDPGGTYLALEPRGQLVAYDTGHPAGGSRVMVRRWPTWELLAESPAIERCDDVLLGIDFTDDARFVRWYPPNCTGTTPRVDSLLVPVRGALNSSDDR